MNWQYEGNPRETSKAESPFWVNYGCLADLQGMSGFPESGLPPLRPWVATHVKLLGHVVAGTAQDSWLLAALGFAVASALHVEAVVLFTLAIGLTGIYAAFGAFFSLPSSFLRGTAAAGGIGLFGMFGNFGGFFGPTLFGILKEGSGDYASGMIAAALGMLLAASIVLALGRAIAPRPILGTNAKVS